MMKKKLVLLTLIFFIGMVNVFGQQSAQTKQETKAKELIRQYLFENLNDYKSYESVLFGQIDTLYLPIEQDSTYKAYFVEDARIKKEFEEIKQLWRNAGRPDQAMKDWEDRYQPKLLTLLEAHLNYIAEYKGEPIGLKMTHRYRAKNALGAMVINEYVYGFDFGMTKIISIKPKE